jgi:hypothetical protein
MAFLCWRLVSVPHQAPSSAVRQLLGSAPEQGVHAAHGEGAHLGIDYMKDGPNGVSCSPRSGHWCTLIHLGLRECM